MLRMAQLVGETFLALILAVGYLIAILIVAAGAAVFLLGTAAYLAVDELADYLDEHTP